MSAEAPKKLTEEEAKALAAEKAEEFSLDLTVARFFKMNDLLNYFKREKGITKKGCVRAIQFALNAGITDKKIVLSNEYEKQMSSIILEMLGPRTIMQAHILNQLDEKELENGEESKVD